VVLDRSEELHNNLDLLLDEDLDDVIVHANYCVVVEFE